MDKFLEVVYLNQLSDTPKGERYEEFFLPLMSKLKSLVSEEVYNELVLLFTDCITDNNRYYAVEGMKLAIGIMDGTYIPIM